MDTGKVRRFGKESRNRDSSGNPFYKGLATGKNGQSFVKRLKRIARSRKIEQGKSKGKLAGIAIIYILKSVAERNSGSYTQPIGIQLDDCARGIGGNVVLENRNV